MQYAKVALNPFAVVRSHVDRIGTIMEWDREHNQRHRLILGNGDSAVKVDVVGGLIHSSEDPNVESSFGLWKARDLSTSVLV